MIEPQFQEFTLPFVGREEELHFLLNEYDQMLHAQYRSVWIEAPAGMGKTTLVEEFLKRISVVAHSMRPVSAEDENNAAENNKAARHAPLQFPFQPWIVHAHLRERSSNSLASFVEALGVTLQTLTEQQREKLFNGLTSFYRERAKKIVGGGKVQSMDMEEAVTAAGYILKQLSKYFPLVVIIEDIHVLKGEMSFYALRHLQAIMEQVPMMMMIVSRPSEEKYLKQFQELSIKEGCEKYEVKSLKYEDIERLVVTHRMRHPDEDAKKLMHLSGGNPLLLRELLRGGTLDPKDSSVPTTEKIIHYLTKELEQLSKRDRQVVAIAGMLGEEFSEQLLHEITKSNDFKCWSEGVLLRLENKGILRRRSRILIPEAKGKEVLLRVAVFSHALWWEAARKLYAQEQKHNGWSDKKFAETIVLLLHHRDYPLLTDPELLSSMLTWLPRTKAEALLYYIDSLCGEDAKWSFHSHEEHLKILFAAHECIEDFIKIFHTKISKSLTLSIVRILGNEILLLSMGSKDRGRITETTNLILLLLTEHSPNDSEVVEELAGQIHVQGYSSFYQYADREGVDVAYTKLSSLNKNIRTKKTTRMYVLSLMKSLLAYTVWVHYPEKAAEYFYSIIKKLVRPNRNERNLAAIHLLNISILSVSQKLLKKCAEISGVLKQTNGKNEDTPFITRMVKRAQIELYLKIGNIREASAFVDEFSEQLGHVWRLRDNFVAQASILNVWAYQCDYEKATGLIEELFSIKFSQLDETRRYKWVSHQFFLLERWEALEKFWTKSVESILFREVVRIPLLLEERVLACLLHGDNTSLQESFLCFKRLVADYPLLKTAAHRSLKKLELFSTLQNSKSKSPLQKFNVYLKSDKTLSLFDKAHYAQLFTRIGVQYGHDPKKFSELVNYSLEGFTKLSLPKRVVFTAEKFSKAKLISQQRLQAIRKKYRENKDEKPFLAPALPSERLVAEATENDELRTVTDGVRISSFGTIEAFTPDGNIVLNELWGKRKSSPSYTKRILVELIRGKLEHRAVSRQEFLSALFPRAHNGSLSEKKLFRLDRLLSVRLSELKKTFSPFEIFVKTEKGYSLHSSVKVDFFEAEETIKKAKILLGVHAPSAFWLLNNNRGRLTRGEFARGIKEKDVSVVRKAQQTMLAESEALLVELEKKIAL